MWKEIQNLRNGLSIYTVDEIFLSTIKLIEMFSTRIPLLNEIELEKYQCYISDVNSCISNGDLLMISDIIKFDIYPLFRNKEN